MRKTAGIVSLLLLIIISAALLFQNKDTENLSVNELRKKFRCERTTADELATDIYCENPEYYHSDVEKGAVINPSDFDDPRYKAMYAN